jgi:hypothetical protein
LKGAQGFFKKKRECASNACRVCARSRDLDRNKAVAIAAKTFRCKFYRESVA